MENRAGKGQGEGQGIWVMKKGPALSGCALVKRQEEMRCFEAEPQRQMAKILVWFLTTLKGSPFYWKCGMD